MATDTGFSKPYKRRVSVQVGRPRGSRMRPQSRGEACIGAVAILSFECSAVCRMCSAHQMCDACTILQNSDRPIFFI